MILLRCEYPGGGGNAAVRERPGRAKAKAVTPARAKPSGPRVIRLKPRTFAQKVEAHRAEREIRAREHANYTRLRSTGTERDHAESRRADNRAVAEHEMNQRFRAAKVVGG